MPKALNFEAAAAPARKAFEITSFAGIDLSSAPADVDRKRSPDAPNMMPDALGNPVKRPGFDLRAKYPGRINGSFSFGDKRIIHAGDELFLDGEEIWDGMADERSFGQIIGDRLYIFDGLEALCFDGEHVFPLADAAYIPTVLISKNADFAKKEKKFAGDGVSTKFALDEMAKEITAVTVDKVSTEFEHEGGKIIFETAPAEGAEIVIEAVFEQEPGGNAKEEFNLISSRWKESFLCSTGTETQFSLSKTEIASAFVRAFVMGEDGSWQEKTENEDFTVDRKAGKVIFAEPVGKTPVTGTDNLVIEAAKHFEGYAERINRCTRGIAFDAGGTATRLFICGNPEEPNRDHWCAANDPTYWPDTYYSELGGSKSEIIGYAVIEGYLAAFINPAFDGRSVVLRTADIDEGGNVLFPIVKHLQGEEAMAPGSFVYMEREPLFLTGRGVYAVTAEDVSGEKYTQNRSFYINKALCAEESLEKAFCMKWKQFYLISINRKIYLLDTSQRSYQRGEPLSSFQYECYLWNGFEARVLWEEGGRLYFGNSKGEVFWFTEGKYSDNGKAINAYWTIPDFFGDNFWRNKTVRMVALQAAALPQNEIRLEYRKDGFWNVLKEWKAKISFFSWSGFSWADFIWSGDSTARTLTVKTKIKKFDKTAFRIVGAHDNRGFGLYGFALEYTEGGRYKK